MSYVRTVCISVLMVCMCNVSLCTRDTHDCQAARYSEYGMCRCEYIQLPARDPLYTWMYNSVMARNKNADTKALHEFLDGFSREFGGCKASDHLRLQAVMRYSNDLFSCSNPTKEDIGNVADEVHDWCKQKQRMNQEIREPKNNMSDSYSA